MAIDMKYGYDFKGYSRSHVERRLKSALEYFEAGSVCELICRLLKDYTFFCELFDFMSIYVTEMFREPGFFQIFREQVVPMLKTYPFIKIWHAGCATGEEVYSMAILLQEEGIYDRCQIYATDFNDRVLKEAEEGIYPIENLELYSKNYIRAGGTHSFSLYYHSDKHNIKLKKSLRKNIVFASHNLITDSGFGDMNVIICRNVLIYFNRELQERVLKLFHTNILYRGFLCLGSKETMQFSTIKKMYAKINSQYKMYSKIVEYE